MFIRDDSKDRIDQLKKTSSEVAKEITISKIREYWQEAGNLIKDLNPDRTFTTPQLVIYLNQHLPKGREVITKTKLNYLRDVGILNPRSTGTGETRTSWRYTSDDVYRALVTELLRSKDNMSIQEIKGWLQSFEEAREIGESSLPTPVEQAVILLRNRVLGTLITALGRGQTETTPRECFIALKTLPLKEKLPLPSKMKFDEVKQRVMNIGDWHIAASFPPHKLYLYKNIKTLTEKRPELYTSLIAYSWFTAPLLDSSDGQSYEVIVGLPDRDMRQKSSEAIQQSFIDLIDNDGFFNLRDYPGLSTLLRIAFVKQLSTSKGTTLGVLSQIIAETSDVWDYSCIFLPEVSEEGKVNWVYIKENSDGFPPQLEGKRVEVGRFLSGWCYTYNHPIIVEATVEGDPRIAFFDEERPKAAAAVPAVVNDNNKSKIMGVVYVGRHRSLPINQGGERLFNREIMTALEALSMICGDVISRDDIEIGTVRGISRLCTQPIVNYQPFENLEKLLEKVVDSVFHENALEYGQLKWVHILTVQIQIKPQIYPRLETVAEWLYKQIGDLSGDFLSMQYEGNSEERTLEVGGCEVEPGRFVFAILKPVSLQEEKFKNQLISLRSLLMQMKIAGLTTSFYPWGVSYSYNRLYHDFITKGTDKNPLKQYLVKRVRDALTTSPYISRGHDALRENRLDDAIREFKNAIIYAPNSPYLFKHLAEAYMLKEDYENAFDNCHKAMAFDPLYASAHCLLADCLSYQNKFDAALGEYEKAIEINSTRPDFYIRYGIMLARMPLEEYKNAYEKFTKHETDRSPHEEAMEKLERARDLETKANESSDDERRRLAEYRYHHGFINLQMGHINEALEDFAAGRRLVPTDLRILQAYSYTLGLLKSDSELNPIEKVKINRSQSKE